jgi:hypothetical protein
MTQEDLEQIRTIVSSALSANNQVLLARMRAIEEHLDRSIAGLGGGVNERLDRIERRLDRLECRFTAFEFQMAGIVSQSPRLRSAMTN